MCYRQFIDKILSRFDTKRIQRLGLSFGFMLVNSSTILGIEKKVSVGVLRRQTGAGQPLN